MTKAADNMKKIPRCAIIRAPGLLPMLYTLGELEEELGVPAATIRGWTDKGAPHEHDSRGHIMINGRELAQWVIAIRQSRPRHRLKEDEGFCFHCREVVRLVNPQLELKGKRTLLSGTCPRCGGTVNRGGRSGQS